MPVLRLLRVPRLRAACVRDALPAWSVSIHSGRAWPRRGRAAARARRSSERFVRAPHCRIVAKKEFARLARRAGDRPATLSRPRHVPNRRAALGGVQHAAPKLARAYCAAQSWAAPASMSARSQYRRFAPNLHSPRARRPRTPKGARASGRVTREEPAGLASPQAQRLLVVAQHVARLLGSFR